MTPGDVSMQSSGKTLCVMPNLLAEHMNFFADRECWFIMSKVTDDNLTWLLVATPDGVGWTFYHRHLTSKEFLEEDDFSFSRKRQLTEQWLVSDAVCKPKETRKG